MKLTDLNIDELILIFKFCSPYDLPVLAKVCRMFEEVVEKYFYENACRDLLMVTHVKSFPEMFNRTLNDSMTFSERLRVNQNWTFRTCQQIVFFQHRENYITHLQMDSECLYSASLGEFNIYQRRLRDGLQVEPIFTAGHINDSPITSLKRCNEMIAGSRRNGSVFTYSDNEGYSMEFLRSNPIVDLDFRGEIFLTATANDTKFHRLAVELDMLTFDLTELSLGRGLESVNFNPTGSKILGTDRGNFFLIDPKTALTVNKFSIKPQIYNSLWINDSSFLHTSRNYPLALIDTRCEFYKQQEFSCGNFTATSIDYDGRFGVVYGTLLGMMVLCDLRNTKMFERVFHLDTPAICRNIKTDESHMFVSTDNAIFLLNFN